MKDLRIFANNSFLIEIEKSNYLLEPNEYIEILNCEKPNLLLKIYPIDQINLSIPYCLNLKLDKNKVSCGCLCSKIYDFKNRVEIYLEPFLIQSNIVLYTNSHTVKNNRYAVACFEDRIKISSLKGEYTYEIQLSSASSFVYENNINILCNFKDKKSLVSFNVVNNVFNCINGDKIEIEENKVKTLTNFNDMAKHIRVCEYVLKDDFELENQSLYTKDVEKKSSSCSKLIPYNFFESIKVRDFTQAKTYLSDNLKDNITDEQLLQYFGEFQQIEILSLDPLRYTLYSTNFAKDYEITMQNNKISEINEIWFTLINFLLL